MQEKHARITHILTNLNDVAHINVLTDIFLDVQFGPQQVQNLQSIQL